MKKYEEVKIEIIDIDHKDIFTEPIEEGQIFEEKNFNK